MKKLEGRNIRIVISGGGTGGHVFPAIAIANALKEKYPAVDLLFVGAQGRLEMEKVPEAGYRIEGLWISGFQRSLSLQNLLFPFKLISSILRSRSILNKFEPDAAVGVGGYASGPLLFVASKAGIPVVIQEQNSYPGITNKLLAKRADKVCVAYDGMERFFPKDKIIKTGNPVRGNLLKQEVLRDDALAHFGLKPDKKTLLVLGGSLGSLTLNTCLAKGFQKLLDQGYQVIWQCGKLYHERLKHLQEGREDDLKLLPFITEMEKAYAAADVIISRAGAIAISELSLVGKPVILVPSPNVAENHQYKNAKALEDKNAAWLITDKEAPERLVDAAIALLQDEGEQQQLGTEIKKLGIPGAAAHIAEEIIELIMHQK